MSMSMSMSTKVLTEHSKHSHELLNYSSQSQSQSQSTRRCTLHESLVQQLKSLRANPPPPKHQHPYTLPSYSLPLSKTTRCPIDQELSAKSVTYYLLNFERSHIQVKIEDAESATIKIFRPPRVQRRFYQFEPSCEQIVSSFRHRDIPNSNTVTLVVRSQQFIQHFDNFWNPNEPHWNVRDDPAILLKTKLSDGVLDSLVEPELEYRVKYRHDVYFLEVKLNSSNCRKYRITNFSRGHVIFHMLDRCRRFNTEMSARAMSILFLAIILCSIQIRSGQAHFSYGMSIYWLVFYSVLLIYPIYFLLVYFYYRNRPVIYSNRPRKVYAGSSRSFSVA